MTRHSQEAGGHDLEMYSLVDYVGVLEMFTSCSGTSEVKETM